MLYVFADAWNTYRHWVNTSKNNNSYVITQVRRSYPCGVQASRGWDQRMVCLQGEKPECASVVYRPWHFWLGSHVEAGGDLSHYSFPVQVVQGWDFIVFTLRTIIEWNVNGNAKIYDTFQNQQVPDRVLQEHHEVGSNRWCRCQKFFDIDPWKRSADVRS